MELRVNNFTNTSTLVIWKLPLTSSMISYTNTFYKIYYQYFNPLFSITNLLFITLNWHFKVLTSFNYTKYFKYVPNSLFLPKNFKHSVKKLIPRPLKLRFKSFSGKKISNKIDYVMHPVFFTNSMGFYRKSFQALLGEVYFNRNILLFEDLDQKRLFKASHLKLPSVFKKLRTRIRRIKYTSVSNKSIRTLLISCVKCSDNKSRFLKLILKLTRVLKKRKFFKQLVSRIYNLLNTFNKSQFKKIKSPRLRLLLDRNIILGVKRQNEHKPYMFIKNKRFLTKPNVTSKNKFVFQIYKYCRKRNKARRFNVKLSLKTKRYVYSKTTKYVSNCSKRRRIKETTFTKKYNIKLIRYTITFYSTLTLYLSKTVLTLPKQLTSVYLNLKRYKKKSLYFLNYKKINSWSRIHPTQYTYINTRRYKYGLTYFYRSRRRFSKRRLSNRPKKFKRLKRFKSLRYRYRSSRLIRLSMFLFNNKLTYRLSRFFGRHFKCALIFKYKRSFNVDLRKALCTLTKKLKVQLNKSKVQLNKSKVQLNKSKVQLNKSKVQLKLIKSKKNWLTKKKKKAIKKKLLIGKVFNVYYNFLKGRTITYYHSKLIPLTLVYYLENTYSTYFPAIKYLKNLQYNRFSRLIKVNTTLVNSYRDSFVFKVIKFNLKSINRIMKRKGNKYFKSSRFTISGSTIVNVIGRRAYKDDKGYNLSTLNTKSMKKKKKLNVEKKKSINKKLVKKYKVAPKRFTKFARVRLSFRTLFIIYKLKLRRLLNRRLKHKRRVLKLNKRRLMSPSSNNNRKVYQKKKKKNFNKKLSIKFKTTIKPKLSLLKDGISLSHKNTTIYLQSFRKMYNNYRSNKLWFKYFVLLPFSLNKLNKTNNIIFKSSKFHKKSYYFSWKIKTIREKNLYLSQNKFKKSQKFDIIRPIHKLPFILPSYGFLYITNLILPDIVKSKISFSHTRFDYSFTSVRDLKKQRLARFTKAKSVFKLFFMNKLSSNGVSLMFWNNKLKDDTLIGSTIHASGHNFKFSNKYWNGVRDIKQEVFIDKVTNKKVINIKRIKFKPGYSKIWRAARTSYKQINNLNFKYQHRLTKYLLNFYRTRIWKLESYAYFKLSNILNDSLITSDKQTNLFFIKNDWIYVNGHVCTNPSFVLGVGDFLQMTVHLKYYVMYRWLLTWSIVKQNRFKQLIHARFHNKVWRADKQSTIGLPAWLLDLEVRTKDVSKHIEVDYLTLSAFVLFDPIFIDNTYLSKLTEKSSLIANMYNWKYIT